MLCSDGSPSSLDVALWAQLALVLDTDLPNTLLASFLTEQYPDLVNLHHRVQKTLFPDGWPARLPPPVPPTLTETLTEAVSGWWPFRAAEQPADAEAAKKATEDTKFKYGRWAWFAGASAALVAYVLLSGIVVIDFGGEDDEWDEEEEEEEVWVEDDGDEGHLEGVVESIEHRERSSSLPVWDDDEEPDAVEQVVEDEVAPEQGADEVVVEEVYSGLPVWDDDEEEEAQRQREENTGAGAEGEAEDEVSDDIDAGPLNGEPSLDEEIIADFNPATAEG